MLVKVQQIDTAIAQETLNVVGLDGSDEERRIQFSLLQGLGRGSDILLDKHSPRVVVGESRFDQTIGRE
jgi:hypothetical protein